MNPLNHGGKLLPDHPLVGTVWASNNGHYPHRVVMAVCASVYHGETREHVLLTNNIPGMKTWRLLDKHGDVSGHHRVADADPNVARLASMFEGIKGINVEQVAFALRYPQYRHLPGPGDGNPKASVYMSARALAALGERIWTLQQLVEQQAISTFEDPGAGYAPAQPAQAALSDLEARMAAIAAEVER